MKGFLLGLLVAGLAFGGYLYWKSSDAGRGPRVAAQPDAGAPVKKRRRRAARAAGDPAPESMRLSAADRKMVGQGDDLGRPEVVRLDFEDQRQIPELSQEDIDARFKPQEEAVLDCIARARPAPEAHVPGLVNVKFRIQRSGAVRGVRVEAPAILMRGGLHGCLKDLVEGLRFAESGSSQIVTYPFRLH